MCTLADPKSHGSNPPPLKLKAFWQSCAKVSLKYFAFIKYCYHVHVLLQGGM